jgi:ubiquinone/menaquinone biosynthesis C-methylase UbiE
MTEVSPVPGSTGGQHILAKWIDHDETYGAHVIAEMTRDLPKNAVVVDLGAGSGRDLNLVKAQHPSCITVAIEAGQEYAEALRSKVDRVEVVNIERSRLPFEDESVDVVLANQILEHTKDIFWICNEVSRVLKVGGLFVFGVPNVLSLHNRVTGILGTHPSQHKLYSAHVRVFSPRDTCKFFEICAPGIFEVAAFRGSQFYPLPKTAARWMSRIFPSLAFSIFFSMRKKNVYDGSFIKFLELAKLETNFFTGHSHLTQYKD